MLNGFKQFILRGNVVDMAVGVVIGAAFGAVVTALTKDLLTPLIAAVVHKPDFSAISFTLNGTVFPLEISSTWQFHFCSSQRRFTFLSWCQSTL